MLKLEKTPYTPSSGGCRRTGKDSWSTNRAAATAHSLEWAVPAVQIQSLRDNGATDYWFYRGLAQFNISDLPTRLKVISTTLTFALVILTDDNNGQLVVAESTQPDEATLATGHYNDITLNSPTELAPRITFNSATNPDTFTFNTDGKELIEALRSGSDDWLKLSFRERKDVDDSGDTDKNVCSVNLDTILLTVNYEKISPLPTFYRPS